MPRRPDAVPFEDLLQRRLSRRTLLQAGVAAAPFAMGAPMLLSSPAAAANGHRPLAFKPIAGSMADEVLLSPGYTYDILIRWGDSLWSSTPDLDTSRLPKGSLLEPGAAALQARQFGQNCDAIHFFPLDKRGKRGLLCVNNEYTDDALMFAGHPGFAGAQRGEGRALVKAHPELVAVSKAAQGVSIIEIVKERGRWRFVKDSRYNRRITAETPIDVTGPARGSSLLQTSADPQGVRVMGTMANCAAGQTPWGTYLTTEENLQDYFGNMSDLKARKDVDPFVVEAHRRFRMWGVHSLYGWEGVDPRFDLAQTPTEPFRYGWIVEIDPLDPTSTPAKRTALGRFAHEGANTVVASDGRVVVYMGDDDKFEHLYKFVSAGRYDPKNRAANRDLLDRGTLYVARFDESGRGQWLPLVYDPKGPLNAAAGFRDQADVLVKARAAGSVLGATPMDRLEDVEANPSSGRIYMACTRNEQRTISSKQSTYAGRELDVGPNAANPRGGNQFGHIIEMREANDDHAALEFSWEVFLLAGDPAGGRLITSLADVRPDSTYYAGYANFADLSPIGSPDNLGFDPAGNLWVVTDGTQPKGTNDGCFACPTSGPQRGRLQQFMSAPVGAEVCGCRFSPDGETLFLSIQHPGEGGSVLSPVSRWPDGPGSQPRSSVIAVRKEGGGLVGT
jgi:secreted PhoX family phosphatase